jgi:hypothetical protein
MQYVGPVHDTPVKYDETVPEGLGLGTTVQALPFHCSTRVPSPTTPTAIQKLDEVQLTAVSPAAPLVAGLDITAHCEPFHCSCKGAVAPFCDPTATQKLALTQESPVKLPCPESAGVWTVQFDALTVAGEVEVAAPAAPDPVAVPSVPNAPTRRKALMKAALRTATARRVKVVTAPL